MKTVCKPFESLIADRLFGEPADADRERLRDHLAECPDCARLLADMERTLRLVSVPEAADPGDEFWDSFAERVQARIDSDPDHETMALRVEPALESRPAVARPARPESRSPLAWFRSIRPISWAAAIAFLAIGLMLGRTVLAPIPSIPPAAAEALPGDIPGDREATLARTQAYLDRSKMLLLELAHFNPQTDDPAILNLPRRSRIAQELVLEAADLDVALSTARERRLRSLVSDLEGILVQIAHLEAESDSPAIELLQTGVDRKALMFRIDVEELRAAGPDHKAADAQTSAIRPGTAL